MKAPAALLFVCLLASTPAGPQTPATEEESTALPQEEELEEFIPSEKVPADSAISFPVDI